MGSTMNLSTLDPTFPQVHVKWTVLNTRRPTRYTRQWPYYSSNFSFPGSSLVWFLKLTDDFDFYETEEKVKEANEYGDSTNGTHYVLSICREPSEYRRSSRNSSYSSFQKLKIFGTIGVERMRADCLDLFVHLKDGSVDTIVEAGTLFDKWDNGTNLNVDLFLECEPLRAENLQDTSNFSTSSYSLHGDVLNFVDDVTAGPTNVTLVGSDGSVGTHKLLLSLRSNVFRTQFDSADSNHPIDIELKEMSKKVLADFVRFLSTDRVSNMRDHANELLQLADKYQVRKLKETCEDFLSDSMNEDNSVCRILQPVQSGAQVIERRLFNMYHRDN